MNEKLPIACVLIPVSRKPELKSELGHTHTHMSLNMH